MRFAFCLMNPPYSGNNPGDGLYVKFINKSIDLCDRVVSVNPANVIMDHQSGGFAKAAFSKLRRYVDIYNTAVEIVDNAFDASLKSDVCILYVDTTDEKDTISVTKNNNSYVFSSQQDICIIENRYLSNFKDKLVSYIGDNYAEKHLKLTKYYNDYAKAKLKELDPDKSKYYVYCIKPNSSFMYIAYSDRNKYGLNTVQPYSDDVQEHVGCGYFTFDTKNAANNFLKYINSSFVLMCVRVAKALGNMTNRYMYIPWLDFSKSYSDEELFRMIDMEYDEDEIKKILSV